ncbi:MAG: RNA-binding S4 domain-containing protein [Pseudorhodobacter sp.]
MAAQGDRPGARPVLRLDKWLWQARLVKSRSLAAELVAGGHLRVNGNPVSKPAHSVGAGDVLTLPLGGRVRVIRVLALGIRRGPAPEAQALFADLDAAPHPLE